jgi:hypothetical protein
VIIEEAGDICGSKLGVSKTEDWGVHYLLMDLYV